MLRQQSRDSCDSIAFARPRARRALTGLQGLNVRPCPTNHLDQAQAACLAAARHELQFSAVVKLRFFAHGCVLPKIGHYMFKSKEKCSTSGVLLNRTHQLYNTLGSQGQPKAFHFWIEDCSV